MAPGSDDNAMDLQEIEKFTRRKLAQNAPHEMIARDLVKKGMSVEQAAGYVVAISNSMQSSVQAHSEDLQYTPERSPMNWGGIIFGLVLAALGIGLTMGSNGRTVYYGLVLVGGWIVFKALLGIESDDD